MWDGVSVVEKPTAKPVALPLLKQWLRIDHSDDDALLSSMLDGAIARIDGPAGIGYAMMRQKWRKSMDGFLSCIKLPGAPVKSIAAVVYVDGNGVSQTLPADAYQLDADTEPARLLPAAGSAWPSVARVAGSVKVDYLLGEEDPANVQSDLIDALCLIVAHRYKCREAVAEGGAAALPFGVDWILNAHSRCAVSA